MFILIVIIISLSYVVCNADIGLTFDHKLTEVERRFCLRHLYANRKSVGHKGKVVKDALWKAATITNHTPFEAQMAHIELIFPTIHKYLSEINPTLWSQHAFGVGCKSNMLLNNLAETFNSWIKKVYHKPIITICEKIR